MGNIVPFKKAPTVARTAVARPATRAATVEYIGLNLYIPEHRGRRRRLAKRGAAHGILSAFNFKHTKGLTAELFRTGGKHTVLCTEEDAFDMLDLFEESLPHIEVRLLRRVQRAA